MKKLALLACGLMCVLFLTSTAFARPPKLPHRGFDQVGRHGVNHSYTSKMRKAHRSSFIKRSSRAPRYIQAPRHKGEIYGANHVRRAASRQALSRTRSSKARSRAAGALANRVKPAIRCGDGTSCGNAARASKSPASRSKGHRSFLQANDAQQRRWEKIMKLHAEKWEPPQSKALKASAESGCGSYAQCL